MTSSITPPFSLQSALYCACPSLHFERSFVTRRWAASRARGPVRLTSPMCETANIPTPHISPEGVLVGCVGPPPAGTALDLKLYLPGSSEPLHLSGVVAEHAPPDEDTGFWAEFLGASEAQRARIDDLIGRRERAADA